MSKNTKLEEFEVFIRDKSGIAESVKVSVPVRWDEELKDWLLTPEAHEIIENTKAQRMISRRLFEEWIGGPPYERDLYRWPMDETKHSWPGQYKDIAVQLAWEAWCAGQVRD